LFRPGAALASRLTAGHDQQPKVRCDKTPTVSPGFLSADDAEACIPSENLVHSQRFMPQAEKDRANQLRGRLRQSYTFPSGAAIAPALAAALDRLGRSVRELGITGTRQIFRAQDAKPGSRFELGLGAELRLFTATQLNQMRNKLLSPNRPASVDLEVEALLRGMTPLVPSDDPDGRWLHEACGLRTVHRVSNQRV